jgi:hypothetical protein
MRDIHSAPQYMVRGRAKQLYIVTGGKAAFAFYKAANSERATVEGFLTNRNRYREGCPRVWRSRKVNNADEYALKGAAASDRPGSGFYSSLTGGRVEGWAAIPTALRFL